MHIPDSVISPTTCGAAAIAMTPVWAIAGRQVRRSLGTRQVPLLALGAAFSFTIMMFNIPALGGTTAHPVGGTLLAVALGPWAAVIGITVALVVQAVCFGDGGILALAANCFTMAFVLPFVGYTVYRLMATGSPSPRRRSLAAAIGAYIGLNAAAAVVAVLLGIQPALFHQANGLPLYFPFGPQVTLPAMLGTHLLIAGPAEMIVTFTAVAYLQRLKIPLYRTGRAGGLPLAPARNERVGERWSGGEGLWVAMLALIALTPLGLLAKGDAWGEWDANGLREKIKQMDGRDYVPAGTEAAERAAYIGIGGLEDYGSAHGAGRYVIAAGVGAGATILLLLVAGRLLARREETIAPTTSNDTEPRVNADGLPTWLATSNSDLPGAPVKSGNRYLERTIEELTTGAAEALASETTARHPGYLQRVDARAKVAISVLLALVVVTRRSPAPVLLIELIAIAAAAASNVNVIRWLARSWFTAPLFIAMVTLPAALNIITPGRVLLTLHHHPTIAITESGLAVVILLGMRAATALSLITLVTLTTRFDDLLAAMSRFAVPPLFVSTLGMSRRYAALLARTASERFAARRARSVGQANNAEGRTFVGGSIGYLLVRTLVMTEQVHDAMRARGWTGTSVSTRDLHWRASDTFCLAAAAAAALAALGVDRGIH